MCAASGGLNRTILGIVRTPLSPRAVPVRARLIRLVIAALRHGSWTALCLQKPLVCLTLTLLIVKLLNFCLLVALDRNDDIRYTVFGVGKIVLRLTLPQRCSLRSSSRPLENLISEQLV